MTFVIGFVVLNVACLFVYRYLHTRGPDVPALLPPWQVQEMEHELLEARTPQEWQHANCPICLDLDRREQARILGENLLRTRNDTKAAIAPRKDSQGYSLARKIKPSWYFDGDTVWTQPPTAADYREYE
jgi:hypothetical protein